MKSKWFKSKEEAVKLRKQGKSIRDIESILFIPRSTLSEWFKDIELSKKQRERLHQNWLNGLVKSREKAVEWHREQKKKRLAEAENQAKETLKKLKLSNRIIELALSFLYLGEGSKKKIDTSIGNTNPLILKFFITTLVRLYNIPIDKIKCELHLRADQNIYMEKDYWSKELNLPLKNFTTAIIDKRTNGSVTYPNYHGVANIRCGTVAIQRKLMYFSKLFCEEVININYE
ncbi:MAG: hypothetical protein AAB469_02120 [Patescibacteria group bacterium]